MPEPKYEDLIKFYHEICHKTLDHDEAGGVACVTAAALGESLQKVNSQWWDDAGNATHLDQ